MTARILIHDKSDGPSFAEHVEHLPHTGFIGDVHADQRTVFIDEAVCCTGPLLHGHAHQRDACLCKSSAHQFPVAAVRSGNDAAPAQRQALLQFVKSFDAHIFINMAADNRETQDLHEHRAEAHSTGFRQACGLFLADAEAHLDLAARQIFPALRHKNPARLPRTRPSSSQTPRGRIQQILLIAFNR